MFTDNPVRDAERHYGALTDAAERHAAAADKAAEFKKMLRGDLGATSSLGAWVWDYSAPRAEGLPRPQRLQQAWEVLFDAMDYRDFHRESVELLVKAAAGENVQTRVQQLLDRVAEHFADMNTESE
jgi:hypothetical protein